MQDARALTGAQDKPY